MNGRYFTHHPLNPSRETRNTPDETDIIEVVAGQDRIVTPSEAKEFLPVRHDQYDITIDKLVDAVTRQVENYMRKDAIIKKIRSYWRRVPPVAKLSRGPHGDILKVIVDGEELTEGVDYHVEGISRKLIVGITTPGELTVEYESGWGVEDTPPEVAAAVLQELSLQFKNRQDPDTPAMTSVNNLSLEARHLLMPLVDKSI